MDDFLGKATMDGTTVTVIYCCMVRAQWLYDFIGFRVKNGRTDE